MIKEYGVPPKDNKVYIGIDQSYGGFSIAAINTESYYVTVFRGEGSGVDRLVLLQNHLRDTLLKYQIQDVAMEGYAFGSQMANMLGELGGMVKLTLREFGMYPLIVPPTTLKKYVCGKGQGIPKSHMLLYVYKRWGVELTDDNAADAYSLARLVAGMHKTAFEKEVYTKLQDPKFRER